MEEREIIRLQQLKELFDASQDPRPYSQLEIAQMSRHMIDTWRRGSFRVNKVTGSDYGGK